MDLKSIMISIVSISWAFSNEFYGFFFFFALKLQYNCLFHICHDDVVKRVIWPNALGPRLRINFCSYLEEGNAMCVMATIIILRRECVSWQTVERTEIWRDHAASKEAENQCKRGTYIHSRQHSNLNSIVSSFFLCFFGLYYFVFCDGNYHFQFPFPFSPSLWKAMYRHIENNMWYTRE